MGYQAVKEYLIKLRERYHESSWQEKNRFLAYAEYFMQATRKLLIRLLNRPRTASKRKGSGSGLSRKKIAAACTKTLDRYGENFWQPHASGSARLARI